MATVNQAYVKIVKEIHYFLLIKAQNSKKQRDCSKDYLQWLKAWKMFLEACKYVFDLKWVNRPDFVLLFYIQGQCSLIYQWMQIDFGAA